MKNFIIAFLLIASLSCSKKSEVYDLIITNVNLIDGTGSAMQEGVSVYVNNIKKIVKIESSPIDQTENVIDGSGKYLIPGLFDCHVHTTNYSDDFPKLIHYGVTSVFIPGGSTCTNEYFSDMRAIGNQDSIPAPRVFHTSQHFTMEGRHPVKTYANSNWREGETVFFLRDTAQITQLVKQVAQYPILGIKLTIEDGPSPPFIERMPQEFINKTVEEAEKYGFEVFAHVSDNTELEMAIKGGVQSLVHFTGINIDKQDSNQMQLIKKFRERNPSWVTTLMIDKSFLYPEHPEWFEIEEMLVEYRQMVNEITSALIKRTAMYKKFIMEEYSLEDSSLSSLIKPQVEDIALLYDMGFNMVLGSDTGNNFNFHGYSLHEEMQLLEMGGMAPNDIIKMGTLNAAKMLHAEDSLGSIEQGKLADLILLNENPLVSINNCLKINTVIKNGAIQKRID